MSDRLEISPAIQDTMRAARDMLFHEHSLFKSLNLEAHEISRGRTLFSLDISEEFGGAPGKAHSSMLSIIIDSIFGVTVFTALEELKPIATINLKTEYIEDAMIAERLTCEADCIAVRNDVAYVNGNVKRKSDQTVLAFATGAFMVGTRGKTKASRL